MFNKKLDFMHCSNNGLCNKCYPNALSDALGNLIAFAEYKFLDKDFDVKYYERMNYV